MPDRSDLDPILDHVEQHAILADTEPIGRLVVFELLDVRNFGKVGQFLDFVFDLAFVRLADLFDLFESRLPDDDFHALMNSSRETVSSPLVLSTIL